MGTKSIDAILAELSKGDKGPATSTPTANTPAPQKLEPIKADPNLTPIQPMKPFDAKLKSSTVNKPADRATLLRMRILQKPPSLRSPEDNELLFVLEDYLKLLKVKDIDLNRKIPRDQYSQY